MDQFQTPQDTGYGQNPQPQTPPYTDYAQHPQFYPNSQMNAVPTVGNYIAVWLLAMIPLAGIILMIIWAVGGDAVPVWKSNYARAYFVLMAIVVGITILSLVVFGALTASLIGGMLDYYSW